MRKVLVRVPLRADLAGGTLDLWPLYLFHPGARTVNVAISFHAECEVSRLTDDTGIELFLTDQQYDRRYNSILDLASDPHAALIAKLLEHFKLTGIRIVTRTDAPRGSGLGGSSALAVALVRALSELTGNPVDGDDLIELVCDLETRLLGIPAGIQDYYPPVYGGLMSLHLEPGKIARHPLSLPIPELSRHFLLHYSGVQHFSGTNNWEIYRRHIEGDRAIIDGLSRITASAAELEHALETHNMKAAGKALQKEWENRKALIEGISTPEIETAVDAARTAGAWGAKVCGAGGGGSIVLLVPVKKRDAVRAALQDAPGQVLSVVPVTYGLNIERDAEAEERAAVAFAARRAAKNLGNYEQLYEGGSGKYHPYILAECRITYDEPRGGIHTMSVQSLLAPVNLHNERVEWERAIEVRPEAIQMSAVPEHTAGDPTPEERKALLTAATEGETSIHQYVAERARMTLFHNAPLGIWSEPGESRDAFLGRCLEHAHQHLEDEQSRLEATYRRRMDQIREKSEREKRRELESAIPGQPQDQSPERNIAWGQALYNITAGRHVKSETEGKTPTETDSLEHIAQLQRQWDREREQKKEELEGQARAIEEVVLTPSPRNIEVVRYIILWVPEENVILNGASAASEVKDLRHSRAAVREAAGDPSLRSG